MIKSKSDSKVTLSSKFKLLDRKKTDALLRKFGPENKSIIEKRCIRNDGGCIYVLDDNLIPLISGILLPYKHGHKNHFGISIQVYNLNRPVPGKNQSYLLAGDLQICNTNSSCNIFTVNMCDTGKFIATENATGHRYDLFCDKKYDLQNVYVLNKNPQIPRLYKNNAYLIILHPVMNKKSHSIIFNKHRDGSFMFVGMLPKGGGSYKIGNTLIASVYDSFDDIVRHVKTPDGNIYHYVCIINGKNLITNERKYVCLIRKDEFSNELAMSNGRYVGFTASNPFDVDIVDIELFDPNDVGFKFSNQYVDADYSPTIIYDRHKEETLIDSISREQQTLSYIDVTTNDHIDNITRYISIDYNTRISTTNVECDTIQCKDILIDMLLKIKNTFHTNTKLSNYRYEYLYPLSRYRMALYMFCNNLKQHCEWNTSFNELFSDSSSNIFDSYMNLTGRLQYFDEKLSTTTSSNESNNNTDNKEQKKPDIYRVDLYRIINALCVYILHSIADKTIDIDVPDELRSKVISGPFNVYNYTQARYNDGTLLSAERTSYKVDFTKPTQQGPGLSDTKGNPRDYIYETIHASRATKIAPMINIRVGETKRSIPLKLYFVLSDFTVAQYELCYIKGVTKNMKAKIYLSITSSMCIES